MKVLRRDFRPGSERYRRFLDEIRFLGSEHSRRPGVISMIEYHVPRSRGFDDSPWLAMPIGIEVDRALGPARPARAVVEVIANLAEVLAELQVASVFHRDLKPSNLLQVAGVWVLADFGLVAYPEKGDITGSAHGVGSRHYVAPEIEVGSPDRDLGRADVYSLAKTLWVLVARQRYPYAGPHHAGQPIYNLSVQLDDPALRPLDLLIEAATGITPSHRPTMAAFAADLRTFIDPPTRKAVASDERLRVVQRRIQDRTALADAERELRRERAARGREELYRLRDLALHGAYSAFLGAVRSTGGESGRKGEQMKESTEIFDRWGFSLPAGRERYGLVAGIRDEIGRIAALSGLEIDTSGNCRMTAALVVEVPSRESAIVWHDTAIFIPGTATAAADVQELAVGLNDHLAETLERYEISTDRAMAPARPGRGDTTPPRVLRFDLEGSPLTLGGSGGVITLRARLADVGSGVADTTYTSSPSQVRLHGPSRSQFIDGLFQPGRNLADGDSFEGNYVEHIRLPAQFESGEWRIQYLQLVDQVGNSVVHELDALRDTGFATAFTVT